jgi:hypothetical protein
MPIRRRAWRNSPRDIPVTFSSPRWTDPEVGSTSRLMQRIRVDLPAPDGPINPTTCPAGTVKLTSFNALSPVR